MKYQIPLERSVQSPIICATSKLVMADTGNEQSDTELADRCVRVISKRWCLSTDTSNRQDHGEVVARAVRALVMYLRHAARTKNLAAISIEKLNAVTKELASVTTLIDSERNESVALLYEYPPIIQEFIKYNQVILDDGEATTEKEYLPESRIHDKAPTETEMFRLLPCLEKENNTLTFDTIWNDCLHLSPIPGDDNYVEGAVVFFTDAMVRSRFDQKVSHTSWRNGEGVTKGERAQKNDTKKQYWHIKDYMREVIASMKIVDDLIQRQMDLSIAFTLL